MEQFYSTMGTLLRFARVLCIAHATLLLEGCKTDEDRAREQFAAEIARGDVASKRPIRLDGGGGLAMGPTTPADFPSEVPIYPGSTPILGGRSTGPGKPSWSLTMTTPDSKDQATARYKSLLQGFDKVSDLNMGESALSI